MRIRKKILWAILGVAFTVLVITCLITILAFRNVNGELKETSGNLGKELNTQSRELLSGAKDEIVEELANSYSSAINDNFLEIKKQVLTVSEYAERLYADRDTAPHREMDLSKGIMLMPDVDMDEIQRDYDIFYTLGDLIQSEPGHDPELVDLYILTASGLGWDGSDTDYRGTVDYDFREVEGAWYQDAVETGNVVWSDVFYGDVSNELKISCSNPVYDSEENLIGVVTAAISVSHLYESVLNQENVPYEAALILDENGDIMINQEDYDLEEAKNDSGRAVSYAPIEESGWTLCIVFPFDEIERVASAMEQAIDEQSSWISNALERQLTRSMQFMAVAALIVLVGIFFFSRKISDTITHPLDILTKETALIGKGDLDRRVELHSKDEIEQLGNQFNTMVQELKGYMQNLEKTTKEKQKIESELNVARNIQESMLPKIFPTFTNQEGYEVAASMNPAKEVGGDFFDLFYVDGKKEKLAFVVADVSGKGVPAALFMVIAKTLLKNHITSEEDICTAVEKANSQLKEGNTQMLFVTAFIGVLDIPSGRLEWVNAGHNPPLLCRKEGSFSYLDTKKNLVLAVKKKFHYEKEVLSLYPGDKLFLYTDGATEANNTKEELFGEERLKEALNRIKDRSAEEIRKEVFVQVEKYAEGVPQFDDITLMALEYQGMGDTHEA